MSAIDPGKWHSISETVHAKPLSVMQDDLSLPVRIIRPDSNLKAEPGFDSVAVAVGAVPIEEQPGLRLAKVRPDQFLYLTSVGVADIKSFRGLPWTTSA